MKHWFTSDWHLFCINFLKNEKRLRFASIEEMNNTIEENIFTTTKASDNLYLLGDIGWKFPDAYLELLFTKFKKHKLNVFWIEGNHDRSLNVNSSCLKWKGQIKDIVVEKQPITLCHYPLLVWNRSHYSAWNFHGHLHYKDSTWNKLQELSDTKLLQSMRYNVNIELHNFKPVEFEDIKEHLRGLSSLGFKNFDYIERTV